MNRVLRYYFLFIVLGLIISAVSVTEAKAQVIGAILKRMDAHNQALQSLRADLTMVKYDATLKIADTPRNSKIQYLAKSKAAKNKRWVRVDSTNPDEQMSLIGDEYTLYRPRLPQVIKGTDHGSKGGHKIGNALAFLNMSKSEFNANYTVIYIGEEQIKGGTPTWHIQLNPKMAGGYKMAELWVDKDGMPRQIKTTEPNNDTSTVLLSNIQKNITVSLKSFEIEYPKSLKPIPG